MRVRLLPVAAAVLFLAGAAYYASAVDRSALRRPGCDAAYANRAEVEKSYADVLPLLDGGRRDEAVMALRRRAERGPFEGAAHYLLGEAAYAERAYGASMRAYRKALETEPSLGDRDAPFDAGRTMLARAEALRKGPWAGNAAPEAAHMNFLIRRLSGGCK